MTTAKHFRGGRVFTDDEAPLEQKPSVRRYPCFATGCPMPGTMWPGITQGGTGERPGTCVWHYAVNPNDIPRVTQRLQDWQCVVDEMNAGRHVLSGDLASDPLAQNDALVTAWRRLHPLVEVSGWADVLKPKGNYGEWIRLLEEFLGARVLEVRSVRGGAR